MSVCLYCCLSSVACKSHLFCTTLYCYLWPVWLYHIFPQYLFNGTNFRKRLLSITCVLVFSTTFAWNILILRRIQQNIIINIGRSSCKVIVILVRFYWLLDFLDKFMKNTCILNLTEIRPVGAEFFHTGRQRDTIRLFSQFYERS